MLLYDKDGKEVYLTMWLLHEGQPMYKVVDITKDEVVFPNYRNALFFKISDFRNLIDLELVVSDKEEFEEIKYLIK